MGIINYITNPDEVASWAIEKLKLMRAEWGKIGMISNPECLKGINAFMMHETMATYAAIQGASQNPELSAVAERIKSEGFSVRIVPFYPLGFPLADFPVSGPVTLTLDPAVHVHFALYLERSK